MKYIKELDSIRAVAVILVIVSHWLPNYFIINRIPIGTIGVDAFFVLSGFLISKILFDNKNRAEELKISKLALIKNFYIRRALRIFPIYYLTIFLLVLFAKHSGSTIQSSYMYHILYVSNFYYFKVQGWDGTIAHFWSLAVEEQFYIIWPWIILFSNKNHHIRIIILFIFIGIVSKYIMNGVYMSNILTFTCFEAFGLGAILSWVITYDKKRLMQFYLVISFVAVISFLFFIIGIIHYEWKYIPLRTLTSLIVLWLITYIMINQDSDALKFKFFFNNKVLIFLGKISYGLYLYHNIIPSTLNSKLINIYINPSLPDIIFKKYWGQLYLLENTILLIVISFLSFIFIERKFLNLKKYFEYKN